MSRAWQGRSGWLALTLVLWLPPGAWAQETEPAAAAPARQEPDPPEPAAPTLDPSLEVLAKAERAKLVRARVEFEPSAEQVSDLYPEAARRKAQNGRATVECEIGMDRRLTKCVVTQEDPTGYGFGDAVLRAAALYRVSPPNFDGQPVPGAKFRIPMRFQLDLEVAAAQARAADPGPAKQETPEERLKRLGPLKRSDDVLWAPIGFAIVVLAGLGRGLMPLRRGRRVARPADQRA